MGKVKDRPSFQEPRPPKVRSIAHLLKLVDEVSTVLSEAYEAQRRVRRQIYPEKPPEGFQYNRWDERYRAAVYVEKEDSEDEYTLLVINFGYSDYYGRVVDSWSSDWYRGVDDQRLWERVWKGKNAPAWPGNDMEKLAYEGLWLQYVNHTERVAKLATEHLRLEKRTRQLETRRWTLMAGVKHIVEADLRRQDVNRYHRDGEYQRDRKVGPRVLLDGKPCYFEGERFVFGEITDTYIVPTETVLPETDRNYNYGEGSNANLRHKIFNKQREKEERKKRNGR